MRPSRCAVVVSTLMLVASVTPGPAQEPLKKSGPALPYRVVDTGQKHIFGERGQLLKTPQPGEPFFGQDGYYRVTPASYTLSADGLTVHDNCTDLTWQRSPNTDDDPSLTSRDKLTWPQAQKRPAALNAAKFGGYTDWRLPSIKELYSLIDFRGTDPSGNSGSDTSGLTPFIDTKYFQFAYGQLEAGERIIDSQYASSTLYVGKTRRGEGKLFGVNFADGRIKGYGLSMPGGREKTFFVQCVRGNPTYGRNDFQNNNDGTITDRAAGLMWSKADNGKGLNWQESLAWVQTKNRENYLGHRDWRLPTAKELQSLVDYSRCPDTTQSAAIDPLFECTSITNEAGQPDFPCYWTGTTHGAAGGRAAIYVAFGRAMGYMGSWQDVHGAGAQRSDPKAGDPANFPQGRGPQGDAIRIYNYVRLVRNVQAESVKLVEPDLTPLPIQRMPAGPGGPGGGMGGPGGGMGGPGGGMGGPGGGMGGPGGGMGGPGGGPGGPEGGFHLIPRFAVDQLDLTPAQIEQIGQLEKEAKAKLDKILTPAQQKALDEARPPFPGGPGGRPGGAGPGGAGPGGVGPGARKRPLAEG